MFRAVAHIFRSHTPK